MVILAGSSITDDDGGNGLDPQGALALLKETAVCVPSTVYYVEAVSDQVG